MTNQASGVFGYYVFRGETKLGFTSANNFADTTVSPGVEYSYTVVACDRAGNRSPVSVVLKIRTPAVAAQHAPAKH